MDSTKIYPVWLFHLELIFGAILIFALIADESVAFKENVVAAWTMDEGAGNVVKDVTGNHEDGKINGKAEWVNGKFGSALRFDAKTHVQIPFNKKFQVLNEGDFTFSLWFKTEELATDRGIWIAGFQQDDLGGTGRTWFGLEDATDNLYCFIGGNDTHGPPPKVDTWHHFAVVVTEEGPTDDLQVYSNGKPELAGSQLGVETNEGDYLIGCHKNRDPTNCWLGIIDDIVLINKALSEPEVEQLMNSGIEKTLAVDGRGKLAATWGILKSRSAGKAQ